MSKWNHASLSRRQLFKGSGALLMGTALGARQLFSQTSAKERRYVFVICAAGGASIVDSFLAQATGPVAYQNLTRAPGSPFSAAPVLSNSIQGAIPLGNGYAQSTFLTKHGADTMVMTCEVSSVNHLIAAKRSITGDNVFGGRTLQEAVAMKYGSDMPLGNLMLAGGGYANHGDDIQVPDTARGQVVSDPLMFAFSTHGSRGMTKALNPSEISRIRQLRNQLESESRFFNMNKGSPLLDNYLANRERVIDMLEDGDTITKLMMIDPATTNLEAYGLAASPDFNLVRSKFTNLATDSYEARLALGFLAVKNKLSTAVSIAPSPAPLITAQGTPNAPIAFDWSHVDHRGAQNSMWSYILKGVDGLIDLLKATDDPANPGGAKMWDQSLIYIATEFGRDKVATGGSGHHLNNGVVMISPRLNGNKVFGGIDAATGLTFGFDPNTGEPKPNTKMNERDVYSVAAAALGIDFEGRKPVKALVRGST
jgi:hypothetical protein